MKKLARHLLRVPPRAKPSTPRRDPTSVYAPLDSWVRDEQYEISRRERRRSRREREEADAQVPEIKKKGRKWVNRNKVRNKRLSFAVSTEEERIIRRYLRRRNMKFSGWCRDLVFDEMNEELPPRD